MKNPYVEELALLNPLGAPIFLELPLYLMYVKSSH